MFWKKSGLISDGRSEPAKQLTGRDMRSVEQCSSTSLPSSTDADCSVKGALKFAQIGGDGATKMLRLLIEPCHPFKVGCACFFSWRLQCGMGKLRTVYPLDRNVGLTLSTFSQLSGTASRWVQCLMFANG